MWRFRLYSKSKTHYSNKISIHQMWRFRSFSPVTHTGFYHISIHQMWRFRYQGARRFSVLRLISIHQMWRFRPIIHKYNFISINLFQYIKCGGSALFLQSPIQASIIFQYIKCGGSAADFITIKKDGYAISIHQMWRFRFHVKQ